MATRIGTVGLALFILLGAGCGQELDVGSDLLWTAFFERNNLDEYTTVPGGAANANPPGPNTIEVSSEHAHRGGLAAKLTIDAGANGVQQNTGLLRKGGLPVEAYYSAWYYLPRTVTVGTFWVIFKFRMRGNADDPASEAELYDLDLSNLPSGEMTLHLYNHRTDADVPLAGPSPIVPVGVWFHIEAHYRNTNDAKGRVEYWLNGRSIVAIDGPMGPNSWAEWDVVSLAENLTPSQEVLFVDDCAISRSRVGPDGILAAD